MARCKHRWGVGRAIQCALCREYKTLGESNDDSDAVRIEIEAARLLAFGRRLSDAFGGSCRWPREDCLDCQVEHLVTCIRDHDFVQLAASVGPMPTSLLATSHPDPSVPARRE